MLKYRFSLSLSYLKFCHLNPCNSQKYFQKFPQVHLFWIQHMFITWVIHIWSEFELNSINNTILSCTDAIQGTIKHGKKVNWCVLIILRQCGVLWQLLLQHCSTVNHCLNTCHGYWSIKHPTPANTKTNKQANLRY